MAKKLVVVYRAAGEAQAHIVKGLLEENGIACLLSSHAAPSVHSFTADGLGTVNVMVEEDLAEDAKQLIRGSNGT